MRKYEKYKPSTIAWLGEIPGHWDINRAKTMFLKVSRPVEPNDDTVTCFRDGVVTLRKNRRTSGFTESLKEIGYQGIRKGDLVIHAMDAFAGAIGVSDSDGKGTPVYNVCTPQGDFNNYYYAHIVREMAKTNFIQSLYRGIRERSSDFRFDVFGKQFLPVPPLAEQEQIVRFLDSRVGQINLFVRGKKREIELLKELIETLCYGGCIENQVIVNQWYPNTPTNWKKVLAKRIFEERKEKNFTNEEMLAVTQDRGIVLKKDCSQNYVTAENVSTQKLVKQEDFVISLRSFQGGIEYSKIQGIVSPAYNVFFLKEKYSSPELQSYYRFFFKSKPFIALLYSMGGGIRDGKNISFSDFSQIEIPLPSKDIMDEVFRLSKIYDSLSAYLPHTINLIQEYKTRLISDAVTGKIDVRNIEIPETDSFEDLTEQEIEITEDSTEITQ